ncbi:MAG TPA: Rne/Rng family ribonuclease [Nevskiaceae bacterium]|nr:Rne/Rng family ribonuclease [Nevskiaceae bacterium]
MKRILINATQREELRVAIVDGQQLFDLDIDTAGHEQRKSNVYKGRITRVEPSLEACFVDYGAERHGFLPLKEVAREYLKGEPGNHNIREQLSEGQQVIVQVEKEERGNKGAALTTFISLAGRFLVLMPNNPRAGGISRRVEGSQREEIREALAELQIPEGMGIIVRTNGMDRSAEQLQWDLDHLTKIWSAVSEAAAARPAPFLVYHENNIVLRALRDYLRPDIGEVIVDSAEIYEQARTQMAYSMPGELPKLKLYRDNIPLFSRYQIESQIESAHARLVRLPSGGSIVIDPTEALTSVDVNSAKSTGSDGIEETAYKTNLEAADEVARQLRLRDLGGLVVIDFIDMGPSRNQRDVEHHLAEACAIDRARVQIGHLSRFGLLELSRQRLRPSLEEHSQITCPQCEGRGQIRSVDSLSLSVLRLIEEECMKDRSAGIIAQLPVDVATFLLNEKRASVNELAERYNEFVTLIPNETLRSPHFEIQRVRTTHSGEPELTGTSYALAQDFAAEARAARVQDHNPVKPMEPAVRDVFPDAPAPLPVNAPDPAPAVAAAPPARPSLWQRFLAFLGFGSTTAASATPAPQPGRESHRRPGASRSNVHTDNRHANDNRGSSNRNNPQRNERRNHGNSDNNGRNANRRSGSSNSGQGQRSENRGDNRNGNGQSNGRNGNNTPRNENRNRDGRGNEARGRNARQGEAAAGSANPSPVQNRTTSPQPGDASRHDTASNPINPQTGETRDLRVAPATPSTESPQAQGPAVATNPATEETLSTPVAQEGEDIGAPVGEAAPAATAGNGRRRRRGRRGRGGRGRSHASGQGTTDEAGQQLSATDDDRDDSGSDAVDELPSANPAVRATHAHDDGHASAPNTAVTSPSPERAPESAPSALAPTTAPATPAPVVAPTTPRPIAAAPQVPATTSAAQTPPRAAPEAPQPATVQSTPPAP